ncbi:hypothetical protein FSOLCH5_001150 [Fusarium solani]
MSVRLLRPVSAGEQILINYKKRHPPCLVEIPHNSNPKRVSNISYKTSSNPQLTTTNNLHTTSSNPQKTSNNLLRNTSNNLKQTSNSLMKTTNRMPHNANNNPRRGASASDRDFGG